MYMRYAGGGIGHYQIDLNDPRNLESTEEFAEDVEMDVDLEGLVDQPQASAAAEDEDNTSENGSNSGSSSGESEDGRGCDENHFDLPEDGEGGFIDVEDEEGYAEL